MKQTAQAFCIFLLILTSLSVSAQKKNEIIAAVGGFPVTEKEFEASYLKNNSNVLNEKDKKTPTEYLDLYINFKLKILEARKLGYDTAKVYTDELKGYRAELAKPYLTDITFNDAMVQTAYHRTLYERQVSHLLILVQPDASPADTLAAWNKIANLKQQIVGGADFNEMAAKHSEDPSAVENKGQLGYFSAFQMVYPFEERAYRTPVGQVSEIVRTRFGYHLIKVHDERPARGEIKVAHIMKMFPRQASEATIAALKLQADSIWQKAVSGADFAELAKKHSDDKQSAAEGGAMNWFSSGNMVPEFAEAAFALKNDGEISPVIRTPYGWHIIKRLGLRTIPPFEKLRPELEARIRKNPEISQYSDEAFVRRLRTEYQLTVNETNLQKLNTSTSSANDVLFSFAGQTFSCGSFTEYLQGLTPDKTHAEANTKALLDQFINQKLLEYENTQLEKKYPEFADIHREYREGILLFNISKDKIWDVATTDSLRLQNYYNQTPNKHYWNDRYKGWIIQAKDLETRTKAETLFDQNDFGKQKLEDIFNSKTENAVRVTEVAVEKGENPIIDFFIWNGAKPSGFDETTTFVHGEIVQREPKNLKDAWGLYSSDFQEQIEKEWIDSLRKQYTITINKKVLKKIQAVE